MKFDQEEIRCHSASSSMQDNASIELDKDSSHESRMFHLLWFITEVKQIDLLGYAEHTSDWDLYLEIELYDGTTFLTPSGFPDIEFQDKKLDDVVIGLDTIETIIVNVDGDEELPEYLIKGDNVDDDWDIYELKLDLKSIKRITLCD